MLKELKHLVTHSAIYGLTNILAKGVGFIMIPIYTHYILPSDYGVYELLDLVVTVVGIFLGIGIVNAVARFYFLYDSQYERNLVVSSAIYCLCIVLALFIPAILLYAEEISILIFDSPKYTFLCRLVFISFAFNSVLEIPLSYLRFIEKPFLFSIVSISRLVIQLSLNIFYVVYLHQGISGIIKSGLIVSVGFGVVLTFLLLIRVGWRCNRTMMWEMVKFGSPMILTNIGMFIFNFADRFYLKKYTSLSDVGIYALGYKMGFLITFLVGQPFSMIWNYWRYDLIKQKDGEELYGRIFMLFFAVLMLAWLGLSIFSRELITIMADEKYFQAYKVVPLVAMAYVFREIGDYYKGMFFIEKSTQIMGWVTLAVAGIALLLYGLFIPVFGLLGAAFATMLIFLMLASVYFFLVNRIRYINYHMYKNVITLLTALVLFIGGRMSEESFSWVVSCGVKIFLIALFPLFFYRLILTTPEQDNIKQLLKQKLSNVAFVKTIFAEK